MRRFEKLWTAWQATSTSGASRAACLAALADEDVIELLTGAPPSHRLERNLLATEALNRMSRARVAIVEAARDASEEFERVHSVVAEGIVRARLEDDGPDSEARDERNETRERALDHIRSMGALLALERLSAHLARVRDASLAHTRHPEMYLDVASALPATATAGRPPLGEG